MRLLTIAVLAAFTLSCAMLRSAVPTPSVGGAIDAASAGVEGKQKWDECEAFAQKPIGYAEESAVGGAIALALAAKGKGGVFVEVAPELVNLNPIPKGKYDKDKPAPGTGPKTDLTKYLNTLGKGLASYSDRPTIDWVFIVLDNPTPNAFSAPGGYVFITTGMLKSVKNEAQLAGILGHELGHVTGKHALEAYRKSKKISCLVGYFGGKLADGAVKQLLGPLASEVEAAARALNATEVLNALKMPVFDPNKLSGGFVKWLTNKIVDSLGADGYGEHEKEADAVATRIVTFAGYDVAEYEKVVAALPEGVGAIKHPSNKERLAVIAESKAEYAAFAEVGKAPPVSPTVSAAK
ncbi:MAG: M48 family metallopeptidase [Myxococcales bacterium]|nr:M48 family metallopeptidase [Myxococcales bacterium]